MEQYKTVAGPRNINVGKGNAQEAFNLFAEIINKEAQGGWEYHSMKTISVTEKPGCLQRPVSSDYYMLIFSKEMQGTSVDPLPEQTSTPPFSDTITPSSGTAGKQRGIKKFMGMFAVLAVILAVSFLIFSNIKKNNGSRVTFTGKTVEISEAKVGDTVQFGSYEQDNNLSNGAEAIEWLVLDKQDGKLLLLSKYALDAKPYNERYTDVTWETCTLRSWLNGEFYQTAFSRTEQGRILTTKVKNEDNPYGAEGGNDTEDKVFLLSIGEVLDYFNSDPEAWDTARCAKATEYARAQGAWRNAWWWLRSPGMYDLDAAGVDSDGNLIVDGGDVGGGGGGVRPAFWLNLES